MYKSANRRRLIKTDSLDARKESLKRRTCRRSKQRQNDGGRAVNRERQRTSANVIRRLTFNETLSWSLGTADANPRSRRTSFLVHLPSEKSLAKVPCPARQLEERWKGKCFPADFSAIPSKCEWRVKRAGRKGEKKKCLRMTDRPALLTRDSGGEFSTRSSPEERPRTRREMAS